MFNSQQLTSLKIAPLQKDSWELGRRQLARQKYTEELIYKTYEDPLPKQQWINSKLRKLELAQQRVT
jgi:hypothetical protein